MSITIVVGYDFSQPSEVALNEALHHAARIPGSVMHVLMALEEKHSVLFPDIEIDYRGASVVQERMSETIRDKVSYARPAGLTFYVHARIGHPAQELLTLAQEASADIIVVGTHGHKHIKRWLVGSVAERLVREAHCSVIVARPKEHAHEEQAAPEPPCPLCVEERQKSAEGAWWCSIHAKPYAPPHRYHYDSNIAEMQPDDQPLW